MTKKKQVPETIPQTKIDKPKAINWTKSQKALYKEVATEAQQKAQESASIVLNAYNKVLSRSLDDFAEELDIADDGHDYDVDVQKFRFVRRPPEPKVE